MVGETLSFTWKYVVHENIFRHGEAQFGLLVCLRVEEFFEPKKETQIWNISFVSKYDI